MDKTIGISELRKSITSIIKDVHKKGSRYIILQHSQAKAVLLSLDEMETLEVTNEKGQSGDVTSAVEDKIMEEISSYEKFYGKK